MAATGRATGSLSAGVDTQAEQALQLWLPALSAVEPDHPLRAVLARADRLGDGPSGYLAGLGEYFAGVDRRLPAAAITRDFLAGDAANTHWLCADPAWVQPDMTGARLLACGRLQLQMDEAQALAAALQPLFEEAGMRLLVSTPDRWHVQLPRDLALPDFAAPEQALGENLAQHLPGGAEGRRWRILLNDIQVLLHQHPLNAERRERGLAPVNSLWLWGGGPLPKSVRSDLRGVVSDDLLLSALAAAADRVHLDRTADTVAAARAGWLIDLQDLPAHEVAQHWWPRLQPLLARWPVRLHASSGERWLHKPWHRWRFWRGAGR
ncbi:MAG: phosphoglycerate mutase [Pseudomonadota bacterium]|nr:phosphoglycerate mutase [Xanthomonadaceae bacterium]MDE2248261.1 phosphoglycerate mutase [Xanthomonadaceae bacterium]MDE3209323.1 phosphoglycerate mutase [Pseudomonadota bacterium]